MLDSIKYLFWQTLCSKTLNNQTEQQTSVCFLKFCMKMKQIKYKYKKHLP